MSCDFSRTNKLTLAKLQLVKQDLMSGYQHLLENEAASSHETAFQTNYQHPLLIDNYLLNNFLRIRTEHKCVHTTG
jgi:hypothetical protein